MTNPMTLAAGCGLLLAVLLILTQGAASVLAAFAGLGIGALWITLLRGWQIAGAGCAWWILLPGRPGELFKVCLGLRWVREAVNTLLPVAHIGGEIIGARLLATWRVGGGLAGASVLVDLLVQTATLVAFSIVGVFLLAQLGGEAQLIRWLSLGLVVMALAVMGFFTTQRMGGFYLIERALLRMARNPSLSGLANVANLHAGLQLIHRRYGALLGACAIHLIVWFIGALEIWIALACMGYSAGYMEALAIESLGHAVRTAGFLIPGALGVQEGGFVAICAVLGIPAPVAIALSLAKRVPELVLGLPGLLAWRVLEGKANSGAKDLPTP